MVVPPTVNSKYLIFGLSSKVGEYVTQDCLFTKIALNLPNKFLRFRLFLTYPFWSETASKDTARVFCTLWNGQLVIFMLTFMVFGRYVFVMFANV